MVVGNRVDREQAAYRAGHRTGNWLLTSFVAQVFGPSLDDMLPSGYRTFSRALAVKSFPASYPAGSRSRPSSPFTRSN